MPTAGYLLEPRMDPRLDSIARKAVSLAKLPRAYESDLKRRVRTLGRDRAISDGKSMNASMLTGEGVLELLRLRIIVKGPEVAWGHSLNLLLAMSHSPLNFSDDPTT